MRVLLIAGIIVILAGLAAIGFGVPVKEFGFGNTLILTGSVGVCTGLVMISLGIVVREMRQLAAQLSFRDAAAVPALPRRDFKLPLPAEDTEADEIADAPVPPFVQEAPPRPSAPEPGVPPWQDEVLRDRERQAAANGGAAEEPKRRNLLFTSTRRDREKERADAVAQALDLDLNEEAPEPQNEPPRFEEPRPRPERPRFSDAIRQAARASATHADRYGDALPDPSAIPDRDPPASPERAPGVTVLKSGVVDGMAYSLYSDGSIEAQMPEGLMRFASIDELREHLDNRS